MLNAFAKDGNSLAIPLALSILILATVEQLGAPPIDANLLDEQPSIKMYRQSRVYKSLHVWLIRKSGGTSYRCQLSDSRITNTISSRVSTYDSLPPAPDEPVYDKLYHAPGRVSVMFAQ